eukprot:scaffold2503_cov301-Prasinococcus_capsulatus_cf.AAC.1
MRSRLGGHSSRAVPSAVVSSAGRRRGALSSAAVDGWMRRLPRCRAPLTCAGRGAPRLSK